MQTKKILLLFAALTKHGTLSKQQRLRYTCVTYGILSIIQTECNILTKTPERTEEIKRTDQGQKVS
jgi:F0F1-type ATP synthase epsilon subunit